MNFIPPAGIQRTFCQNNSNVGTLFFWDTGFTSFSHLTPPMNDKDFEWEGFTPMAVIAIIGAAKPRVVHRAVNQTFVSPVI